MTTEPKPTEAEIAAAREIERRLEDNIMNWFDYSKIIARHNAPLHAKLAEPASEIEKLKSLLTRTVSAFHWPEKYCTCGKCESAIKFTLRSDINEVLK